MERLEAYNKHAEFIHKLMYRDTKEVIKETLKYLSNNTFNNLEVSILSSIVQSCIIENNKLSIRPITHDLTQREYIKLLEFALNSESPMDVLKNGQINSN